MPKLIKPEPKKEENRADVVDNQVQLILYNIQKTKDSNDSIEKLKKTILKYNYSGKKNLKPDAIKLAISKLHPSDNKYIEMLQDILIIRNIGGPKINRALNLAKESKDKNGNILYKLVEKAHTKVESTEYHPEESAVFIQKTEPREFAYGTDGREGELVEVEGVKKYRTASIDAEVTNIIPTVETTEEEGSIVTREIKKITYIAESGKEELVTKTQETRISSAGPLCEYKTEGRKGELIEVEGVNIYRIASVDAEVINMVSTSKTKEEEGDEVTNNDIEITYIAESGKEELVTKTQETRMSFGELFCEHLGGQLASFFFKDRAPKIRLHKTNKEITILSKRLNDFETVKDNPDRYFKFMQRDGFVKEFANFFAINLLLGDYDLNSGNFGVRTFPDGSEHLARIDFGKALSYHIVPDWSGADWGGKDTTISLAQTAQNIMESIKLLRSNEAYPRLLFPEHLWHGEDFIREINNIVTMPIEKHVKTIIKLSLENSEKIWGPEYLKSVIIRNFKKRNGFDKALPVTDELITNTITQSMKRGKASLAAMAQEEVKLLISEAMSNNNKDVIKRLCKEAPEVFKKFISENTLDDIEKLNLNSIAARNQVDLSVADNGMVTNNQRKDAESELDSSFIEGSRRNIAFNNEEDQASSELLNIDNIIPAVQPISNPSDVRRVTATSSSSAAHSNKNIINREEGSVFKSLWDRDDLIAPSNPSGFKRVDTGATSASILDLRSYSAYEEAVDKLEMPGYIELIGCLKQLLFFATVGTKSTGFVRIEKDVSKVLKDVPYGELVDLVREISQDPKVNYLYYEELKEQEYSPLSNDKNRLYARLNKILEKRDFTLSQKDIDTFKKDYLQRLAITSKSLSTRCDSSDEALERADKLFDSFSRNIHFLHANANDVGTIFKIILKLASLSEVDLQYLAFSVMSDVRINPLKIEGHSAAEISEDRDLIFESSKDNILSMLTLMLLQRTPPVTNEEIESIKNTVQKSNGLGSFERSLSKEQSQDDEESFENDPLQGNVDLLLSNKGFKITFGYKLEDALDGIPLEDLRVLAFLLMKDPEINTLSLLNSYNSGKIIYDTMPKDKKSIYAMLNTMLYARNYILPEEILGLKINKIFNDIYRDFKEFKNLVDDSPVTVLRELYQAQKDMGKITDSVDIPLSFNSFEGVRDRAQSQFDQDIEANLGNFVPQRANEILSAFEANEKIYIELTIASLINCFNDAPSNSMTSTTARLENILELARKYKSVVDLTMVDLGSVDFRSIQHRNQDIIKVRFTYHQENTFDESLLKKKYAAFLEIITRSTGSVKELESLLKDTYYDNVRAESKVANIALMLAFYNKRYDIISSLIKSKKASFIYFLKSEFTDHFNTENLKEIYKDLIEEIEIVTEECLYNNAQLTSGIEKILLILAELGGDEALSVIKSLHHGEVYFRATNRFNQDALEIACLAGRYEIAGYLLSLLKPASEIADPLYDTNKKLEGKTLIERVAEKITLGGNDQNYVETLRVLKDYRSVENLRIAVILRDKAYITKFLEACKVDEILATKMTTTDTKVTKEENDSIEKFTVGYIKGLDASPRLLSLLYLKVINTILFLSCQDGWLDQVRELLDKNGMDINIRSSNLMRPLDIACESGNEELLNLIIKHDKFQPSHLDESLGGASSTFPTIVPIIAYTITPVIETKCVPPALLLAIRKKHWHIVEILADRGANPDIPYEGKTILHYAIDLVDFKDKKQVEILMKLASQSQNIPDIVGNLPLDKLSEGSSGLPENERDILKKRMEDLEIKAIMQDILNKVDNLADENKKMQEFLFKKLADTRGNEGGRRTISTVVEKSSVLGESSVEMSVSCSTSRTDTVSTNGENAGAFFRALRENDNNEAQNPQNVAQVTIFSRLWGVLNIFNSYNRVQSDALHYVVSHDELYEVENHEKTEGGILSRLLSAFNIFKLDNTVDQATNNAVGPIADLPAENSEVSNVENSGYIAGGVEGDEANNVAIVSDSAPTDAPGSAQNSAPTAEPSSVTIAISNIIPFRLANPFPVNNFVQDERQYIEITISIPSFNKKSPSADDAHSTSTADTHSTPINSLFAGSFIAKETIESLPIIKSFLNIYKLDASWLSYNSFWSSAHLVVTYAGSISLGLFDPTKAISINGIYIAKQNLRTELLGIYQNSKNETINNYIDFGNKCGVYIAKQALLGGLMTGELSLVAAAGALNNALSSGFECYNLYNKPLEKQNHDSILHQVAKHIVYPIVITNVFENTDFSNSFKTMSSCKQIISTVNLIVISDQLLGAVVNDASSY